MHAFIVLYKSTHSKSNMYDTVFKHSKLYLNNMLLKLFNKYVLKKKSMLPEARSYFIPVEKKISFYVDAKRHRFF